jgi:hypothetical protein
MTFFHGHLPDVVANFFNRINVPLDFLKLSRFKLPFFVDMTKSAFVPGTIPGKS